MPTAVLNDREINPIESVLPNPESLIIQARNTAAQRAIDEIEQPGRFDRIEKTRITHPPINAFNVTNAASDSGIGNKPSWPNLAFYILNLALDRESIGGDKLKSLAGKVQGKLNVIDNLLELSGKLPSGKDSYALSDEMKIVIAKLETAEITVGQRDEKGTLLNEQKHSDLKEQISSHIDKLRTSIQTILSTEIQPEANNLQAIMNIVSQIIRADDRLKEKTQRLPG